MPYPQARPEDPVYLKTFDPHTFYPALATNEEKYLEYRGDSVSVYPSSSISQPPIPRSERPALHPADSYMPEQRHYSRRKLWLITIAVFVAVAIVVLIFAWLGAHNFFHNSKPTFP